MTEKEKREDEILKNCIQEAYGLSDEQLLAELEELEATLSDDEFVGAEERIFERIKAREMEESATVSEEPVSKPIPIRKVSKKKKLMVLGIAAALVVGAGVTTIGNKTYFLKRDESKSSIVLDSGQSAVKTGDLQEAYIKIKETLDIPVIKLNHRPNKMVFDELIIDGSEAILIFASGDQKIYFIQKQEVKERSIGIGSDRKATEKVVHNNWLSTDIMVEENILEDGSTEYSAIVYNEKASYRLFGKLTEKDFCEMLSELSY